MDQWIKLVLIQAVLLLCQTAAYFLVQKFEGPAHDMERAADRRIPLMPQAVFVYILWCVSSRAGWFRQYDERDRLSV